VDDAILHAQIYDEDGQVLLRSELHLDPAVAQGQPTAGPYAELFALCTVEELGKMFICSVDVGDAEFAAALREEIKRRKVGDGPGG